MAKLNELTRPSPFSQEEYNAILNASSTGNFVLTDLIKQLQNYGWSIEGEGAFSWVYVNPSKDYIIKVNKMYDRGFAKFAYVSRKYPNIHFPRFMDYKLIPRINRKTIVVPNKYEMSQNHAYIYKIEKLVECVYNKTFMLLHAINAIADAYNDGEIRKAKEWIYGINYDVTIRNLFLMRPKLEKALDIILQNNPGKVDLHAGNIMQREDGTIVFSDPYAVFKK